MMFADFLGVAGAMGCSHFGNNKNIFTYIICNENSYYSVNNQNKE